MKHITTQLDDEFILFEKYSVTPGELFFLKMLLLSQLPFIGTTLTTDELLDTDGEVKLDVNDVGILEKMLSKTED